MYNGIGLTTPRGSGTSGHVVKNASALRPSQKDGGARRQHYYDRDRAPKAKPLDQGILEHERKRQVEVKCLELQDELEAQGLDDDTVEARVDKFRNQLLQNLDQLDLSNNKQIKQFETQRIAEAKIKENRVLASALRVEEGYVEGAAFDRELQELRRERRLLEKERDKMREEARRREREQEQEQGHGYRSDRRNHRTRRNASRSRSRGHSSRSHSPKYRSGRDTRRSLYSRDHHRSHDSEDGDSDEGFHHRLSHRQRSGSRHRHDANRAASPDLQSGVRQVEDGELGEIEDIEPESTDAIAMPAKDKDPPASTAAAVADADDESRDL
ncbi:RNA-splicing factor [Coemansia guatemalensis]|uniref:RNA-splicing factor n=1 Tax=Coemansia guatemalensis TaxID=2761395 RepID=A0A9W8HME6_9FUNG|nr:RNA-splicing factor [Coemansia guatemalensis]